ncbi:hypothetical protein Tco_0636262 [Tanacetum coccineum]
MSVRLCALWVVFVLGTQLKVQEKTLWHDMICLIGTRAKVKENQIMAASAIANSSIPRMRVWITAPLELFLIRAHFPYQSISPFLCTEILLRLLISSDGSHHQQDPNVATGYSLRSRVTARPSSSSSEFPITPVTAPPEIFRPLPARRLAWRHVSPRSSNHRPSSSSSSSDSSPVHSLGLDAPDQAHSGSSARDVPPRLCYPPGRAPRRSEAFLRWCAAPLSILYPPTTSESSSRDSSERPLHSFSHSVGPSRKRCRSSVDFVPSSTPVLGSLAPTRADLLPPRKRFKDSYSSEASIEEDTEVDPIETDVDMELGIGDGDL